MLWVFIPVAVLVTVTPGPATALVVRSALRGGWRTGIMAIVGNSAGVVTWALLSVLGISGLIAASETAFLVLKVLGAAVLVGLGVQALWRARPSAPAPGTLMTSPAGSTGVSDRRALCDGLVTSLANPKLAVFFVALLPQFVDDRASALATTLLMAGLIVAFDVVWYGALSYGVSRAKRALLSSGAARWLERAMGAVLIALGVRVALQQR